MKVLERVVESLGEPGKHDLWLRADGNKAQMRVYLGNEWVPVCCSEGGGGLVVEAGDPSDIQSAADNEKLFIALGQMREAIESGNTDITTVSTYSNPGGSATYYNKMFDYMVRSDGVISVDSNSGTYWLTETKEQFDFLARYNEYVANAEDSPGIMLQQEDDTGSVYGYVDIVRVDERPASGYVNGKMLITEDNHPIVFCHDGSVVTAISLADETVDSGDYMVIPDELLDEFMRIFVGHRVRVESVG